MRVSVCFRYQRQLNCLAAKPATVEHHLELRRPRLQSAASNRSQSVQCRRARFFDGSSAPPIERARHAVWFQPEGVKPQIAVAALCPAA